MLFLACVARMNGWILSAEAVRVEVFAGDHALRLIRLRQVQAWILLVEVLVLLLDHHRELAGLDGVIVALEARLVPVLHLGLFDAGCLLSLVLGHVLRFHRSGCQSKGLVMPCKLTRIVISLIVLDEDVVGFLDRVILLLQLLHSADHVFEALVFNLLLLVDLCVQFVHLLVNGLNQVNSVLLRAADVAPQTRYTRLALHLPPCLWCICVIEVLLHILTLQELLLEVHDHLSLLDLQVHQLLHLNVLAWRIMLARFGLVALPPIPAGIGCQRALAHVCWLILALESHIVALCLLREVLLLVQLDEVASILLLKLLLVELYNIRLIESQLLLIFEGYWCLAQVELVSVARLLGVGVFIHVVSGV